MHFEYISIFKQELSFFSQKIFQKSTNQKQEFPVAAMFVNGSELNQQSSQRTFQGYFLPSFISFGQTGSEEKIFRNRPTRNMNCQWQPCLLMDWDDNDDNEQFYREPSIDDSYQVSVHLAKRFQRKRFFQKSTNQKQEFPVAAMFVNG